LVNKQLITGEWVCGVCREAVTINKTDILPTFIPSIAYVQKKLFTTALRNKMHEEHKRITIYFYNFVINIDYK
jgi:hypothetical protein